MSPRLFRHLVPLALLATTLGLAAGDVPVSATVPPGAADRPALSAEAAIEVAIRTRLGREDAVITIRSVDLPAQAPVEFVEAQPDPGARLGKPMRFVMKPQAGRPVLAVVVADVVFDRPVATRALARGEVVRDTDIVMARAVVTGSPLRRWPAVRDLQGGRARRPIAAGAVVEPSHVIVRRAVEPGDPVTVVAMAGAAEVTAQLTAADGGDPGDVVRVVNPDTRRDLRARVIERGRVEVEHVR